MTNQKINEKEEAQLHSLQANGTTTEETYSEGDEDAASEQKRLQEEQKVYDIMMKKVFESTCAVESETVNPQDHLVFGRKYDKNETSLYSKTLQRWSLTYKVAARSDKRLVARRIIRDLVEKGCRFFQSIKKKKYENVLVPVEDTGKIEDRIIRDCRAMVLLTELEEERGETQDVQDEEEQEQEGTGQDQEPQGRKTDNRGKDLTGQPYIATASNHHMSEEEVRMNYEAYIIAATSEAAAKAMKDIRSTGEPPVPHVNVPKRSTSGRHGLGVDISDDVSSIHEVSIEMGASTSHPSTTSLPALKEGGANAREISQEEIKVSGEDKTKLVDPMEGVVPLPLTREIGSWDVNQKDDRFHGTYSVQDRERFFNQTGNEKNHEEIAKEAQAGTQMLEGQSQSIQPVQVEQRSYVRRRSGFANGLSLQLIPRPNKVPLINTDRTMPPTANSSGKDAPGLGYSNAQLSTRKRDAANLKELTAAVLLNNSMAVMPPPKATKRARRTSTVASSAASTRSKKKAPAKSAAIKTQGTLKSAASAASKSKARKAPAAAAAKSTMPAAQVQKEHAGNLQKRAAEITARLQAVEQRMQVMESQNRRLRQRIVDLEDEEERRGEVTVQEASALAASYQQQKRANGNKEDGEEDGSLGDDMMMW